MKIRNILLYPGSTHQRLPYNLINLAVFLLQQEAYTLTPLRNTQNKLVICQLNRFTSQI